MNAEKPGLLIALVGGVLLFISSFFDWRGAGPFGANAWELDTFGLVGIWVVLISLLVIAYTAMSLAPQASLPDVDVLGFSLQQLLVIDGLFAVLITFGYFVAGPGDIKFGIILAFIASAAIFTGAILEYVRDEASPSSDPPTTF